MAYTSFPEAIVNQCITLFRNIHHYLPPVAMHDTDLYSSAVVWDTFKRCVQLWWSGEALIDECSQGGGATPMGGLVGERVDEVALGPILVTG